MVVLAGDADRSFCRKIDPIQEEVVQDYPDGFVKLVEDQTFTYIIDKTEPFLTGERADDAEKLADQLVKVKSFFGQSPVFVTVFDPVEDIGREQLKLLSRSGDFRNSLISYGFRQAISSLDEVLAGQVEEPKRGHEVMTDDRDESCFDVVGPFKLIILFLQFEGLFGDLLFQVDLSDLELAGSPSDDKNDDRDEQKTQDQPAPGLLIPAWPDIETIDNQGRIAFVRAMGVMDEQAIVPIGKALQFH